MSTTHPANLLSGQIVVAAAGTAEQAANTLGEGTYGVKAHPGNTKPVWLGNDGAGDVSKDTGFPLNPGEGIVVEGLSKWWFDAEVNGEKFCWVKLV